MFGSTNKACKSPSSMASLWPPHRQALQSIWRCLCILVDRQLSFSYASSNSRNPMDFFGVACNQRAMLLSTLQQLLTAFGAAAGFTGPQLAIHAVNCVKPDT